MAKSRNQRTDKAHALMERGYFPSQFPPPFSCNSIARHRRQLIARWPTLDLKKLWPSRGEHFSVARLGHARRPIVIPNPINQTYLCRLIAENWTDLNKFFKRSELSLSRPEFKHDAKRAIEIVSLRELAERRLVLSAGHRYVLQTDVARFFPLSLYAYDSSRIAYGSCRPSEFA